MLQQSNKKKEKENEEVMNPIEFDFPFEFAHNINLDSVESGLIKSELDLCSEQFNRPLFEYFDGHIVAINLWVDGHLVVRREVNRLKTKLEDRKEEDVKQLKKGGEMNG
jgi:hypothetical protein